MDQDDPWFDHQDNDDDYYDFDAGSYDDDNDDDFDDYCF